MNTGAALLKNLNIEWGYTVVNDRVVAKICPECGATIPYGSADDPTSTFYIIKHRNYHIDVASMFESFKGVQT